MPRLGIPLAILVAHTACVTARPILALPPDPESKGIATVFLGARVFDGESDRLSEPMDVVVKDGAIASIAAAGSSPVPEGAQVVDARGKALLPGLIDAHLHLGGGDGTPPWKSKLPNTEAQAAALVYCGVTTIVAATRDSATKSMAEDLARGKLAGPSLVRGSRPLTAVDGHPVPMYRALLTWPISSLYIASAVWQVETVEEARAAVGKELKATEPDFIKVIFDDLPEGTPHLRQEMLQAIAAEAKAKGKRTFVHVASPQDAMEAVEAGAALLMHVPWDGVFTEKQIRILAQAKVPFVTTRRIYGVLDDLLKGKARFDSLERQVMPPGAEEAFAHMPEGYVVPVYPAEFLAKLPEFDRNIGANLLMLHQAGVPLLAGTDSGLPGDFHGASLHRELQALAALGIPPAEVLRMATSAPARFLLPGWKLGVIQPGAIADLLLVDGDPLADMAAAERIVGVWQAGRQVRRQPAAIP